ncbi:MAG: DNA methyltransferase [Cyanobacteria bacterium P01_D01_bin.128]
MKPYYQNALITLYLGDCREILPNLAIDGAYSLITDPVWPNAIATLQGSDRPQELLAEMFGSLPRLPERAAIHLGTNSDPRFLTAVPSALPFFRTAWLRYSCPSRRGRLLQGSDTAYLFGKPPKSKPGARVIPGEVNDATAGRETLHPCPRKRKHCSWLVNWWSESGDIVLDPFCGSGTTLLAAYESGRKAVGIEIEPRYAEMAAERFSQMSIYALI